MAPSMEDHQIQEILMRLLSNHKIDLDGLMQETAERERRVEKGELYTEVDTTP